MRSAITFNLQETDLTVQTETIEIPTRGGRFVGAIKYCAHSPIEQTIVISSATGVLQHYYSRFAHFFASKGFVVYTFDYSGIGASNGNIETLKALKSDLRSWGNIDQAAVVAHAKQEYQDHSITVIAHSIGGQILGFNTNHTHIDRAVLVASQTGYWKQFKGIHRLKMWVFWYMLIPLLTPIFGYFPSRKLGLFENLPKKMVYEWASWGRKKAYMMQYKNKTDYFFDRFKIPILSLSFHNDPFAPRSAVDWLAMVYANGKLTRVHHDRTDKERNAGHFGFFKSAYQEPFWEQTYQWILNKTYQ